MEKENGHSFPKGHIPWNKGVPMSEETKMKVSNARKGGTSWNKGMKSPGKTNSGSFKDGQVPWNKGKKLTEEQKKNTGSKPGWHQSEETKRKISEANRGKGMGRQSWNFKEWRRKVFEQGGYKCKECGCDETKKLHPHHIIPFEKSIELRFDVANGEILCNSCHSRLEGFKKGMIPWNKGVLMTEEAKRKLSEAQKIRCQKRR